MATIKSYTDKPKRKPYFKHNVVYCKKGDVVITYPNVLAAEAATGIYSDRIYKCCNGKKGFTGGFAWSYTPFEEYPDDGRIWKDVKGYENLYQVSNDGLVRTSHKGLWEILSAGRTKHGYYNVLLHKDGKRKNERVHRLVASAFIPNPNNYPYINHKDENPSNNHVDNLEWCTAEYNSNYGTCKERIANSNSKPILKYDLDGNFICEYKSLAEAERIEGIDHATISMSCSGRVSYQCGYIWIYKCDEDTIQERVQRVKRVYKPRKVAMYDMDGNYIKTYGSVLQASKTSGDSYMVINRQLKTGIITKNAIHIWKQV